MLPQPSFALVQRHHVFLWIHDAINLRGQGFEGPLLLRIVSMAIIDAAHAGQDVPEAQLSVIGTHARAAHERSRGAPKIVQRPAHGAATLVQRPLEF